MGGKGDFDSISVREYRQIIMTSFRENYTPKSFHDTTVKFSILADGWLKRDSVSRDTVFLLGFGLRMPVEDVSMFLKTALKDQDFNVTDPRELIIHFCLKNHRPAGTAIELIRKYCDNDSANRMIVRSGEPDGTMTIRARASQFRNEDELETELLRLPEKEFNPLFRHSADCFRQSGKGFRFCAEFQLYLYAAEPAENLQNTGRPDPG